MSLCSPQFFLLMACLAIGWRLARNSFQRQVLFSCVNLAFLALFLPDLTTAGAFVVFLGGTYALLFLERIRASRHLVPLGAGLACLFFVWARHYFFFQGPGSAGDWAHTLEMVGLSYMLFRFLHVLVDQAQGQLAPPSFPAYANYQLAFFSLVAGPIQRLDQLQGPQEPRSAREDLLSWNRILTGMLKMGILAPSLKWLLDAPGGLPRFAAQFYLYPLFLFANFAGYTDLVVGCAELLGFCLPENFNRPFLARNILDFWDRWHMSLTRWIRDYVFMPSYKAVAQHWPRRAKVLGYGLLFLALLVAGLWHGNTSGFFVFGLLHGLGAATNQVYGDAIKAWKGRAGLKRYQGQAWLGGVARLVTFHYVCFTFLFFALGIEGTRDLWRARGEASWPQALRLGALVVLALAVLWRPEAVASRITDLHRRWTRADAALWAETALKLLVLAVLFLGLWAFSHPDPVVVYQKF